LGDKGRQSDGQTTEVDFSGLFSAMDYLKALTELSPLIMLLGSGAGIISLSSSGLLPRAGGPLLLDLMRPVSCGGTYRRLPIPPLLSS
jgi:hypothetical protein